MATDTTEEGLPGLNASDNSTVIDLYATWPVKDILIASYVTVFVVSLAGNLLVISVIVRNRSMHTVTNFFLANLAVADLLVTVCCIIPTLLWFIQVSWSLGVFVCKAHKATLTLTTTASVFMLTVISMERFIAILYPFRTRQILTARRLVGVVAGVWLLSACLASPMLAFYDVVAYQDDVYCLPTHRFVYGGGARRHGIFMVCACYLFPLLVMLVLYTRIGQGLWARSRSVISQSLEALPSRQKKKGSGRAKAGLLVTFRTGSRKAVTSTAVDNGRAAALRAPLPEGLRIHVGSRMSPAPEQTPPVTVPQPPPPPPTTPAGDTAQNTAEEGRGDTPSRSLLGVRQGAATRGPEMIGPFFLDDPDQSDEDEDASLLGDAEQGEANTAPSVLWQSCNDILLCSKDGRLADYPKPCPANNNGPDTASPITNSANNVNGLASHRQLSKSENVLNAKLREKQGGSLTHVQANDHHEAGANGKTPSCKPNLERPTEGAVRGSDGKGNEKERKRSAGEKDADGWSSGLVGGASVQSAPVKSALHRPSWPIRRSTRAPPRGRRSQEAVLQARRKVIRLLVTMVVCFAGCLFPLQLMFVWTLFGGFSDATVGGALATGLAYLAYFVNSALNPFLYAFLSDSFRKKMRDTLHCGAGGPGGPGSRGRRQASLRQMRLKSMTSDAFTESELVPS